MEVEENVSEVSNLNDSNSWKCFYIILEAVKYFTNLDVFHQISSEFGKIYYRRKRRKSGKS